MALSPDGRWLAVGGWTDKTTSTTPCCGGIRLYDFASGELKAVLKGHTDVVLGLAFSPDGKKLISGSGPADRSAIIWDVETKTLLHGLEGHLGEINAVGFMRDSARAVTGSFDKTLRLWSVADGAPLKEMSGHGDKVRSLAVSPRDGAIASGDWSGEIRLWDGKTGAFLKVFANQGNDVEALQFSPNGRVLLSAFGYCGSCTRIQHTWDIATGQEVIAYAKHDNSVIAKQRFAS